MVLHVVWLSRQIISAHATNASKLICKALFIHQMPFVISGGSCDSGFGCRSCKASADSGCQVCTFEADGDALAERLSDQIPGG